MMISYLVALERYVSLVTCNLRTGDNHGWHIQKFDFRV